MLTTRRIVESLNMERCVETTRSVPGWLYLKFILVSEKTTICVRG